MRTINTNFAVFKYTFRQFIIQKSIWISFIIFIFLSLIFAIIQILPFISGNNWDMSNIFGTFKILFLVRIIFEGTCFSCFIVITCYCSFYGDSKNGIRLLEMRSGISTKNSYFQRLFAISLLVLISIIIDYILFLLICVPVNEIPKIILWKTIALSYFYYIVLASGIIFLTLFCLYFINNIGAIIIPILFTIMTLTTPSFCTMISEIKINELSLNDSEKIDFYKYDITNVFIFKNTINELKKDSEQWIDILEDEYSISAITPGNIESQMNLKNSYLDIYNFFYDVEMTMKNYNDYKFSSSQLNINNQLNFNYNNYLRHNISLSLLKYASMTKNYRYSSIAKKLASEKLNLNIGLFGELPFHIKGNSTENGYIMDIEGWILHNLEYAQEYTANDILKLVEGSKLFKQIYYNMWYINLIALNTNMEAPFANDIATQNVFSDMTFLNCYVEISGELSNLLNLKIEQKQRINIIANYVTHLILFTILNLIMYFYFKKYTLKIANRE